MHCLTATGARPEAFALCARWMQRQTYGGPVTWIVVDDGPEPVTVPTMPANWTVRIIRPRPLWQPGMNTQRRNLLAGMEVVDGPVVVVEDDDYYSSDWLETCERELRDCELVGERHTRYFNVGTGRGREMTNRAHASLCATAMRGRALDVFRDILRKHSTRLDMELWRRFPGRLLDSHKVVGIKGLPGRGGIGVGHKGSFGEPMRLRDWIGSDAEAYGHG